MLETKLKRNRKGNPLFYHSPLHLFSITPPCSHDSYHLPVLHTSGHNYVILLHLHTPLLPVVLQTPNPKPQTGERVQKGIVHWDKQNNNVPAPNCMLKVQEEIIKVEGL